MQTIDKDGNVLNAIEVEETDIAQKVYEALAKRDTSHVVVGQIPTRGQVIVINGLRWKVQSCSKKGGLHLQLMGV